MRARSHNGQESIAGDGAVAAGSQVRVQAMPFAERLLRVLRSEPWWLRGVNWGLITMVGAITAIEMAPNFLGWLQPQPGSSEIGWSGAFADLALHAATALSIVLISAALLNIRRPRLPVPLALGIGVVAGSLLFAAMVYLMLIELRPMALTSWVYHQIGAEARRLAVVWTFAATAWCFLHRSAARQADLHAAQIAQRHLETGMLEARLQALQAQVEPHFLFNTLAHIKRLYRTEPIRARLMLDSFRAYLRSALPQMRSAGATLGREIDLVRAYLDVQQVRMGHRLRVQFDVPEALRERSFPSMMLMSLVENAIKHGLNPVPGGGTIRASASDRGVVLEVSVVDTGRGMDDQIGSGVGLSNIRARLAALFSDEPELSLIPNSPTGVRATIRIPMTLPTVESSGARSNESIDRVVA